MASVTFAVQGRIFLTSSTSRSCYSVSLRLLNITGQADYLYPSLYAYLLLVQQILGRKRSEGVLVLNTIDTGTVAPTPVFCHHLCVS